MLYTICYVTSNWRLIKRFLLCHQSCLNLSFGKPDSKNSAFCGMSPKQNLLDSDLENLVLRCSIRVRFFSSALASESDAALPALVPWHKTIGLWLRLGSVFKLCFKYVCGVMKMSQRCNESTLSPTLSWKWVRPGWLSQVLDDNIDKQSHASRSESV